MASEPRDAGLGRLDFVARHGLWDDRQREAAERVAGAVAEHRLEVIRLSFADQHGLLRGKSVPVRALSLALRNGCAVTSTLLAKDTSHRTAYPVFTPGGGFGQPEMSGASDVILVPDPTTFRVLPWAPATGWLLCDLYFPSGRPVPFSTRQLYRAVLDDLARAGYDYVAGLEVECYILRLEDPKLRPEQAGWPADPPAVSLVAHGYQYLTESRLDELDPLFARLRQTLEALALPLRSLEVEFGPSQVEFTFDPQVGLEPADAMVLFRSAVKQVCRRHGYHATFMCRPALPNLFSSGWHLHQSLRDRESGRNAFVPAAGPELLSPLGRHFVGGLLAHARAAAVFTTPTINGYKRYKPFSLAPDRATWGRDNKGAMVRVVGGPGDPGTHVENRVGEPAANPYLYMAAQIVAGLDGIERRLDPGPPTEEPYGAPAPRLPGSLMEAVAALREDALFRKKLGDTFVDYLLTLKEFEIQRFLGEVTDWEHREYFEIF